MTHWEARIILGLDENDAIDERGLDRYEDIVLARIATSVDKAAQRRMQRELKAIKKLREHYFQRY